jgi:hypothetical protein
MRDAWKYLLVGILVFLAAFFIALPFFGGSLWGTWGMMGPGMMGGAYPYSGWSWFGGFLMMIGMILLPLALVGVLVAGIFLLFRNQGNAASNQAARPCPHCGKFVQTGWAACPYCGEKLA